MKTRHTIIRFDRFSKCQYSICRSVFDSYRIDYVIFIDKDTTFSSCFYTTCLQGVCEVLTDVYNDLKKICI